MKKYLFIFLIVSVITSCGAKHEGEEKPSIISNLVSITANEDKGVKAALDFYGGYCKYAVGFEGTTKYFELEFSNSEGIEQLAKMAEMPASNIAYLFYKNLKEEKTNYDEIHTVISLADGSKMTFKFTTEQLKLVEARMAVAYKVVGIIKSKNYDAIRPMLADTGLIDYDKNEFMARLKSGDTLFGNVTDGFRPYGFYITKEDGGKNRLHISGVIIRDKQSNEFSIDLYLNWKDDKILLLQYKL